MPAEQPLDGRLFDLYRRYIGEPENRTDVYVGFGLFLGGVVLAVLALALFLWSSTFSRSDPAYFHWVEPAFTLGMLSLPTLLLGVVVLLPSSRKAVGISAAGGVVTLAATGGFVLAYPENWNFMSDVDYTVEITATYALGLAGLTASTGAALIAHYLDIARSADAVELESEEEETESYSDEEIQRDIDEAMEGVELSWGGVRESDNTRLEFSEDEFSDVEVNVQAKTTRSSGVDQQVAGLKGLKGGETKTTTSSETVDDQTAKLKELREQQRSSEDGPAAANDGGRLASVLDRLRSLVGRS
ncbi:DUF7139 domain-containing protein [Halopiger goleimassiliensis]|uniref:DUF7139 domain-containing protein n=1 Tax=Halopiger goleimassiliensis TaxID=1293048 RepID=UPI000677B12A|nr:hypothetical protein [Halopiger goleimassiliensis]